VRIVVAITGATGTVYGITLLETLRTLGVETHLVVSQWGRITLRQETDYDLDHLRSLVRHMHMPGDLGAPIASGSFATDGMIVAPCSMRTLAAIRIGLNDNLITRAADVTLKERRRLVLMVRETPFSDVHLENMLAVARSGAVIMPPVPAFYTKPSTIKDIVTHTVTRALDQFGLATTLAPRWDGLTFHPSAPDSRPGQRDAME